MKNRYCRTFIEKYGITEIISKDNCRKLIKQLETEYKKTAHTVSKDNYVFDKLPYIGIIYCTLKTNLWYDTNIETPNLIRNKVISVTMDNCTIITIDDHNGGIAILTKPHIDYRIIGNVCKTVGEIE